jgi:hypothetical protein
MGQRHADAHGVSLSHIHRKLTGSDASGRVLCLNGLDDLQCPPMVGRYNAPTQDRFPDGVARFVETVFRQQNQCQSRCWRKPLGAAIWRRHFPDSIGKSLRERNLPQSRPQGIIVAPWGTHYDNGDAVARLIVADDGRSASGAFTGPVEFMKLRAQRLPPVVHSEYVPGSVADGDELSTTVREERFVTERFSPQRFALSLLVRHCRHLVADKDDGARPVWFYGLTDRSWACVQFRDGATARVWQSGPRRLWDEVEAAYRWWGKQDRPGFDRFGLTVDSEGERIWLDSPDNPVPVRPGA